MGWKLSIVIVNGATHSSEKDLLKTLGYKGLIEIDQEPFEVACYPESSTIYIGKYNGNTIICEQNIPIEFLENPLSEKEYQLNQLFPDTEVCSLSLQSTVNFWGITISKNGKRIRTKGGESENGTFVDDGKPLIEEEKLLSKSEETELGRIYHLEEFPNETFSEDAVGEDIVFDISKRYLDERLDMIDDLLFETNFKGFSFYEESNFAQTKQTNNPDEKPWWKFW